MGKRRITTLWELVAKLRSNLEDAGLQDEVLDEVVVLGVEQMLAGEHRPTRRDRHEPVILLTSSAEA